MLQSWHFWQALVWPCFASTHWRRFPVRPSRVSACPTVTCAVTTTDLFGRGQMLCFFKFLHVLGHRLPHHELPGFFHCSLPIFANFRSFYLLAAQPDGTFDFSHLNVLDITGRNRMTTTGTRPDPSRGFPPPRKQAALDCFNGTK